MFVLIVKHMGIFLKGMLIFLKVVLSYGWQLVKFIVVYPLIGICFFQYRYFFF